jgi:thiosulfate dehydrogenase [quinone] large subunit
MTRERGEMRQWGRFPRNPTMPRHLRDDTRFAPLWLVLRVALGWIWLEAGWRAMQSTARANSQPAIAAAALGDLFAIGLTLAGIALILGILTGPAAVAGGFLSLGLWAGEDAPLAVLSLAAAVVLTLTWRTAGWIGIDRWLLPLLGLPGRGGALLESRTETGATRARGSRRLPWTARRLS